MNEKLSRSGSLVRLQEPAVAQAPHLNRRRLALTIGGASLLVVLVIGVVRSGNWGRAGSDCAAQVVPLERILPTLTKYSHLPKPIVEDVPHYIRTRARSCFPNFAVQLKEEDIPTHRRQGRLPYLQGDPVSVYHAGQLRWLFEVRSREIHGRLLGFVSVGAEKGDLQLHEVHSRHRANSEETVLSKAKALTPQRALRAAPGTKLYVVKGVPNYVVRFVDGEDIPAGVGILPIEGSHNPGIGRTLNDAIVALDGAANVAQVPN